MVDAGRWRPWLQSLRAAPVARSGAGDA